MKYPNNRMIVNGVDLSEEFGLILLDGYTLSTPKINTYTVKIPNSNTSIDLTEGLYGDVTYDKRKDKFEFALIMDSDYTTLPQHFEEVKTKLSNFLHGKRYNYTLTMDPEYHYNGRFTIDSYSHQMYSNAKVGTIKVTVEAEPFKYKELRKVKINAIGGRLLILPSGRMRVRPKVKTGGFVKLVFENKSALLSKGEHRMNNFLFKQGNNLLYVSSYDIRNILYKDLKNITFEQMKKMRIYEWYKSNGQMYYTYYSWNDLASEGKKWADMANKRWCDLAYTASDISGIEDVEIEYEWGDL